MRNRIFISIALFLSFSLFVNSQPTDSTIRQVISKIDTTRIENIIKDLSGENPVIIDGSVSVEEELMTQSDFIYPDPAGDYIFSKQFLGYSYQIFNALGIKMQEGIVDSEIIDLKQLPIGMYSIVLINSGITIFKKFIKN